MSVEATMRGAVLSQLAGLSGYAITLNLDPYAGEYRLRRGDTLVTFEDARELSDYLRAQVDLMMELLDRLG
jgi:hypothetical protein